MLPWLSTIVLHLTFPVVLLCSGIVPASAMVRIGCWWTSSASTGSPGDHGLRATENRPALMAHALFQESASANV
jgi:hypothetical protein